METPAAPEPPSPAMPPPPAPPALPTTSFFLYIPKARLVVMSLVTLGIYEAYWIYRNWRFLKQRDNLRIQPFWRAFFGIFFIYSLLTAIKNDRMGNDILPATFSSGALAAGWIIFMVIGSLSQQSSDLVVSTLGLIISAPTFAFLLPVQNYINRVNESLPIRPVYYGWSVGQIVLLVIAIAFWLLMFLNTFVIVSNA